MKLAIKPLVVSTAALSLMFGVAQNAQAALITGVTASTIMGSYYNLFDIFRRYTCAHKRVCQKEQGKGQRCLENS